MVAARRRACIQCGGPLPLEPIPRYHVCESCGFEPAPRLLPDGTFDRRGPQWQFLQCGNPESFVDEVLFGGTVGGGKSQCLLMDASRDLTSPHYRALLLRRTMPELARTLIERAHQIYGRIEPGGFVGSPRPMWRFRTGAEVHFGYLQHDSDVKNYDGSEYSYIGWDELQHFTEYQYTYVNSRARSSKGLPIRIRATATPPQDLVGAWVLKRFAPWLDRGPDYHGIRAESGKVLYFIGTRDQGEQYVERGTIDDVGAAAKGRTFIMSKVTENPYLDKKYIATLLALDSVTRERLLYGNWGAMDKQGALWSRATVNAGRVTSHPELTRIGVALDPSGSHRKGSDEAGIIVAGLGPCYCTGEKKEHAFVTEDLSGVFSAREQATRAINAYNRLMADFVVAEINYGGDWVKTTVELIDDTVNVDVVHVSKGKSVRAEPVSALYGRLVDGKLEGCRVHHVGHHVGLENEQCTFDPRTSTLSPGRMDALVFVLSKLMLIGAAPGFSGNDEESERRV